MRARHALTLGTALAVLALGAMHGPGAGTGDSPGDGTAFRSDHRARTAAVKDPPARPVHGSPPAPVRGRWGSGAAVTLAFGGDVHFEALRWQLAAAPGSILGAIAPLMKGADLAMVNLETAITRRGTPARKPYTFRAPPRAFHALQLGGVDVATMANNHGLDFGETGLHDSLAAARAAGMPVVGIGLDARRAYAPYRTTVRGQRIAVLGATQVIDAELIASWSAGPDAPGLASAKDEPRLLAAVKAARRTSDTVVVYLHWGSEHVACPTPAQRTLAHRLVAAGADVVVGSHAHVLLGGGRLGGAFVAYGLGNLVFYADPGETSQTGVLTVTVTGREVEDYAWHPARISGSIPRPLTGAARARALQTWVALRACTGLAR